MKKILMVFKKIDFESQILALFDYSLLQCLSTKYNNFLRKFFGQKYSYFVSLPWKFDNPNCNILSFSHFKYCPINGHHCNAQFTF